jgi:hypothetical protein
MEDLSEKGDGNLHPCVRTSYGKVVFAASLTVTKCKPYNKEEDLSHFC